LLVLTKSLRENAKEAIRMMRQWGAYEMDIPGHVGFIVLRDCAYSKKRRVFVLETIRLAGTDIEYFICQLY